MAEYHPFGDPEVMTAESTIEQTADYRWSLTIRILSSRVGDIHRFVIKNQDCQRDDECFWGVARPSQDRTVPVDPQENEERLRRVAEVRWIHPDPEVIRSTLSGVLDDLDEYIRSKKIQDDLVVDQALTFGEADA